MKKVLSIILVMALSIAFCLSFVGCSDEFSGNYKTVASAEEIKEVAEEVEDAEVEVDGFDGMMFALSMKGASDTQKMEVSTEIKVNFKTKQFAAKMETTQKEEGKDDKYTLVEAYISDSMLYTNTESSALEKPIRTQISYPSPVEDKFVSAIDSEMFSLSDITSILAEAADMAGAKVYIDKTVGTKIKISLDDAQDGDETLNGSIYLIYNDNNNLTGVKCEMTTTEGTYSYETNVKLTSFSKKISLPSGAKDWGKKEA